jgi:hypothetical protein
VKDWSLNKHSYAKSICKHSLEPEKVITVLRVFGVPWGSNLCNAAAWSGKLALLQWLHSHSCPWIVREVLIVTCAHGSAAVYILEWLMTVTAPWSFDIKNELLASVATANFKYCSGLRSWCGMA